MNLQGNNEFDNFLKGRETRVPRGLAKSERQTSSTVQDISWRSWPEHCRIQLLHTTLTKKKGVLELGTCGHTKNIDNKKINLAL